MPIEFACSQCGKQLRTPDETAGRQAKCPQCGAIMQIPNAAAAPPAATPPPSSFGGPASGGAEGWNPYASPDVGGQSAAARQAVAGEIAPTRVDISQALGSSWEIFKRNLGLCLLTGITWIAVGIVVGMASSLLMSAIAGFGMFAPAPRQIQIGAFVAAQLVVQVISWVFNAWLYMGIIRCFLRIARGDAATVGDMFTGGPYFVRGMIIMAIFFALSVVEIIVMALVLPNPAVPDVSFWVITLAFVIASVIIYLLVSQSYFLVVDRDLRAMEAISTSVSIMSGNKLALFVVLLVTGVLGIIGTIITCFIGIIAVLPFSMLVLAVFYLQATGQATADRR